MPKIGLMGGTFNPIHLGHLRVAEEVREQLGLSQVIFIPAHIPPHKPDDAIIDAEHRLRMVHMAVEDNDSFIVSDTEILRSEPSYSLYTIRHFLRELDPADELYFIMGADAFAEISTWHRWREVLPMCHFVVMSRPGHKVLKPVDAIPAAFAERYKDQGDGVYRMKEGKTLTFVTVTGLYISSSDIRRRIAQGLSIRYLLPDPVERYVLENGLYRNSV